MNGRVAAALTIFVTVPLQAQDHSHHDHAHEAGVDSRGDEGMGFSHDKVAHHFGLTRSGGFITAEVKDPPMPPAPRMFGSTSTTSRSRSNGATSTSRCSSTAAPRPASR